MTEKEYLDTSDLQKVKNAKELVRDLTVSESVLDDEINSVYMLLCKWEKSLYEKINICE